jgi:hypothetical protein
MELLPLEYFDWKIMNFKEKLSWLHQILFVLEPRLKQAQYPITGYILIMENKWVEKKTLGWIVDGRKTPTFNLHLIPLPW